MKSYSSKDIGVWGEHAAAEYLKRNGFVLRDRNVAFKTGELDIVAQKGSCLHIVEVKTLKCFDFPGAQYDGYTPSQNLHARKIQKLIRTASLFVERISWEGEWQIDAALVWIRTLDDVAKVRYIPQIV